MRTDLLLLCAICSVFIVACDGDYFSSGNLVPRTVDEDPSLPQISLSDGTKVHLEIFGPMNQRTVIVLHGGPGGSYKPYLPLKSLSDSYKVVFWDQRGAGLSERTPNNKLTGEQYVKDLDEIVARYRANGKVILIGHSWGGAFAAYYAAIFPEKVDKMVLLEPAPLNTEIAKIAQAAPVNFFATDTQSFLNSSDYLTPEKDAAADYFRMTWNYGNPRQNPDQRDWRQGYRANVEINRWLGFIGSEPGKDLTKDLKNFTNRVLLVGGTAEKRLGKEFQEKYQAKFFSLENDAVFVIDGEDHYGIISSKRTIEKIRDYLQ